MRLWDRVHPYNAAQVLHLRGAMDVSRLAGAWSRTLSTLGLGRVQVQGNSFRHSTCEAAPESITVVQDGVALEEFVAQELNRPFESEPDNPQAFCPFRPFLLQNDDSFYAGVIYHHWAADSASIRMLLREWFYRMYEPARARSEPLRIAEGGYWHFFGPTRGRWNLDDGLLSTLRLTTRFSNARRVEHHGDDYRVACATHELPDGMIDRLHQAARRQKVTLNDVFLAAIAQACDQAGIMRAAPGRQELAMGTIVDLRPSCKEDLSDVFGLFLGFTTVILRPGALRDWPALLASVARQSAHQKQEKLAQTSLLRMAAAVAESRFLSPHTWVKFYQKHMPLAAGISNVNMSRTWAAEYHPSLILDYRRFSPTGPALPVVFTPSSLGKKSHLALTYRVSLIDEMCAKKITASFVARLTAMAAETGHGNCVAASV
jgi:NRPS condensation-like uncharacterized protein